MDDQEFKLEADRALHSLTNKLGAPGERIGFDADLNDGALKIDFDDPPGRFVVSPNSPVKQIWVSALTKSFKLEWDAQRKAFVLPSTAQTLDELIAFAISEHTGESVTL